MAQEESARLAQILKNRRDKLTELQNAGLDPFTITKYDRTATSEDIKNKYDELEGKTVSIAGRIMSKRRMGKVGFCHVMDMDGQIQIFVKKDTVGEEEYERFKKLDIGDIVGAEGEVFTTQTGEKSVRVEKMTLL